MEYQWVQNFLSSPQLADVISYILLIAAYLSLYFVKRFVKKDNFSTTAKIDAKISKINNLQSKMEKSDEIHAKEREEWQKEKQELQNEIETLKKAIRVCSSNVKELVKSGISNKIAKMLPVEEGEEIKNLNTSVAKDSEEKTQEVNMEE